MPTEVSTALTGASLEDGIGQAQGLIIAAVLVLVGFTMLRKVFGK